MLSVKYHKHLGPKVGMCVPQLEPKTIKELRTCVVRAVGMINRDDLQKAVDGYKRRLELCIVHNGYRFEHAR